MLRITYDQTPKVNFSLGARFLADFSGVPVFTGIPFVVDYIDPVTNTFDYAKMQAAMGGNDAYFDWQVPFSGVIGTISSGGTGDMINLLTSIFPGMAVPNISMTNIGQSDIINQVDADRLWAAGGGIPSDYIFTGQLTSRGATVIANANTTSVVRFIHPVILSATSGSNDAALVQAEGTEVIFNLLDERTIPVGAVTYLSLRGTLTRIGNIRAIAARRIGPSLFLD